MTERVYSIRLPVSRWQQYAAWRQHVQQRLNAIEDRIGWKRSAPRKSISAWRRHIERRLRAIEDVLKGDEIDLDLDTVADRIKRPEIARALVRLLLGAPPIDPNGKAI